MRVSDASCHLPRIHEAPTAFIQCLINLRFQFSIATRRRLTSRKVEKGSVSYYRNSYNPSLVIS